MMKKRTILASIILVSTFLLLAMGYRCITNYMKDRYAPNTWVDGVYCTGRTVGEVNEELIQACVAPVITVTDAQGKDYALDMSQTDYQFDYTKSLAAYQEHQVKNGWFEMMFHENQISKGKAEVAYDGDKVKAWWDDLPIVTAEEKDPVFQLVYDKNGYRIRSTLDGHLNTESGLTELVNAVNEGTSKISLTEKNCYYDYELDASQKQILKDYEELLRLEKCGLTYDMGAEKIVFDEALMSTFIAKDTLGMPFRNEEGNFYYDMAVVETFIRNLCEQYHTYGVERPFHASRGEIVMVPAGTYGTEIDWKAEKTFLLEYLSDASRRETKTVHIPVYLHETDVKGLDDVGGTYVEVDMTEQKIYFYKDYELMVTSGVVTGNLRTRHGTPAGAFFIYGKYKNRVLRGPGYASFVRRWMPVVKAIGLHDANWRDEFGGEIYKTNGSHGCVNMPDETTDIIYEYAEVGTPVLIFY